MKNLIAVLAVVGLVNCSESKIEWDCQCKVKCDTQSTTEKFTSCDVDDKKEAQKEIDRGIEQCEQELIDAGCSTYSCDCECEATSTSCDE